MATYTEQEDKLHYEVVDNDHPVMINLTPIQATVVQITYGWPSKSVSNAHRSEEIGNYESLKDKEEPFSASFNNPSGSKNQFSFTITQEGNPEVLTYDFPQDYTGTPPYVPSSGNDSLDFIINFD